MTAALTAFERIARGAKNFGQQPAAEKGAIHPFDERNIHTDLAAVSIKLFDDGHYAQATFEAFKLIDNRVKVISGLEDIGFSLMMNALNEAAPRIRLNDLATLSEKDEQKGFRYIFAGAMAGIRNPRGHDNVVDPIDVCLDHLSIASVLLRTIEGRKAP
ncbi:TIGR02391 family protein [Bosea vaviloviae]|uniref:TIGR02391 family protein n=1 Tax=Bosea vaviloviae TaxID=1526658 RepID=A0A1D7U6R8_9HYPH|nr:TIGR02391 family protein [Bosea vaviloviae]AOO83034.1 TIGR02391 family protein [Bosea vaviloviae]